MNVYNAVEDAYLTFNKQHVANLSDVRFIVRKEVIRDNMYSIEKSEREELKKRVRNSITGQLTFNEVFFPVYKSELLRVKNPNIIAKFDIIGLFRERFTNTKQKIIVKNVTVNDMSFSEISNHLQPGIALTFKASRVEGSL